MSLKGALFQLRFSSRMKQMSKIGAEKGHIFSSMSTRPKAAFAWAKKALHKPNTHVNEPKLEQEFKPKLRACYVR